ncbi:MAG: patatin-like phospholipase family protein [Pseudonocardia sp.]|nr:patatin-like phospholipase family protein [Pseudonocardia sp.]
MAERTRALVLGGGGITGIGWEIGLLAGLADLGVDLTDADLVVGTSAGSVVGAHVASGADMQERYEAQLVDASGEIAAKLSVAKLARLALAIAAGSREPKAVRARIGKLALATETVPEGERLAVMRDRLTSHEWPQRPLLVTAVEARTGEFRVFDRTSGVPLVEAVAASCAVPCVWPPVTTAGTRWIDGGFRSVANADLAGGYDSVVVLAPATRGVGPIGGIDSQVEALRARADVCVVSPGDIALEAIGRNPLDPARRAPSARAGRAQASSAVDAVRAVWERSRSAV